MVFIKSIMKVVFRQGAGSLCCWTQAAVTWWNLCGGNFISTLNLKTTVETKTNYDLSKHWPELRSNIKKKNTFWSVSVRDVTIRNIAKCMLNVQKERNLSLPEDERLQRLNHWPQDKQTTLSLLGCCFALSDTLYPGQSHYVTLPQCIMGKKTHCQDQDQHERR